ncbi:hypothetical protein COT95_01720 [Candidatus Falkowbacteria bacterium CG10_big_fil_rev_8_21_14_0_10_37_6]|uniref:Uncharacterized protein n=1 Tax=Candidatus Falkowbacteria bacterium CG10_big_fil_rev_8_21_14_0_10_37_6 TaxID=1974563 RepID=A0A2H0V704_9BACT|nr:MAG: hypothetical protein COT95_01720 [Candidatus Falkowbacteria bacterium CG10_big_fil_rev_8_21_14_0_10_37_6]
MYNIKQCVCINEQKTKSVQMIVVDDHGTRYAIEKNDYDNEYGSLFEMLRSIIFSWLKVEIFQEVNREIDNNTRQITLVYTVNNVKFTAVASTRTSYYFGYAEALLDIYSQAREKGCIEKAA